MHEQHIKIRPNDWGSGTIYTTYEEYWQIEVIAPLIIQYKKLTGELIDFPMEDARALFGLVSTFNKKMEKVGDFGTG